jgi:hypothetical protein
LTTIDWNALNATEMPEWLAALASNDGQRQFRARSALSRYLGQHALALNIANYEYNEVLETDAPIFVTTILIEMLRNGSELNPRYVTEFLEIVSSYWKEDALGEMQRQRASKIHELMLHEFDLFVRMTNHSDPEVRVYSWDILYDMPEKQLETARLLLHRLEANQLSDESECLKVIDMLLQTIQDKRYEGDLREKYIKVLNQWLEDDKFTSMVLAHTACYLILLQGEQVSQAVVAKLVDILKVFKKDLLLGNLWIDALVSLGINQATPILVEIFNHQTDDHTLVEISAILLSLHFRSGDFRLPHFLGHRDEKGEMHIQTSWDEWHSLSSTSQLQPMSEFQKSILRQFIVKDQFWKIQTNLFELYSLPVTRSELEQLITENA